MNNLIALAVVVFCLCLYGCKDKFKPDADVIPPCYTLYTSNSSQGVAEAVCGKGAKESAASLNNTETESNGQHSALGPIGSGTLTYGDGIITNLVWDKPYKGYTGDVVVYIPGHYVEPTTQTEHWVNGKAVTK